MQQTKAASLIALKSQNQFDQRSRRQTSESASERAKTNDDIDDLESLVIGVVHFVRKYIAYS